MKPSLHLATPSVAMSMQPYWGLDGEYCQLQAVAAGAVPDVLVGQLGDKLLMMCGIEFEGKTPVAWLISTANSRRHLVSYVKLLYQIHATMLREFGGYAIYVDMANDEAMRLALRFGFQLTERRGNCARMVTHGYV